MNRVERKILTDHSILLRRIGEDLAMGRLESDQVAKWLRILALRVRMTREDWIKSATFHWLEDELQALSAYENPE